MPKLSGLFDSFDNLDQIDIDSLILWLKNKPSSIQLENYLANKILYPQITPITADEMKIDLAILREILRLNGPRSGEKEGPMLSDKYLGKKKGGGDTLFVRYGVESYTSTR